MGSEWQRERVGMKEVFVVQLGSLHGEQAAAQGKSGKGRADSSPMYCIR
jgi:hypothetical protein